MPFAAIVGGIAVTLPLLYGANRERQKEADISANRPVEVDEGAAFITGLGQSALESLSLRFLTLANKSGLKVNANFFQKVDEAGNPIEVAGLFTKLSKKAPRTARVAGAVGTGASLESATEVGQQLLERAQAGLDIFSDDALAEYLEAGVAGGIVGGTLKGGVTAISKSPEAIEAQKELRKRNELDEADAIESIDDQEAFNKVKQQLN